LKTSRISALIRLSSQKLVAMKILAFKKGQSKKINWE
jgi:hypothetical protein